MPDGGGMLLSSVDRFPHNVSIRSSFCPSVSCESGNSIRSIDCLHIDDFSVIVSTLRRGNDHSQDQEHDPRSNEKPRPVPREHLHAR